MSDVDEPQAEASLATSRSRRDRGRKKASRLQELDNLKASRIHGKRQLGIHFLPRIFTAKIHKTNRQMEVICFDEFSVDFLDNFLPRKSTQKSSIRNTVL